VDERGHLAAWRKRYGGPPGTGFVRVWGARRAPPDPAVFATAAELRPHDPEGGSGRADAAGVEHFPDGSRFERVGIARDIRVVMTPGDLREGRGSLIERALELLAERR
jgi:hypothetical protein